MSELSAQVRRWVRPEIQDLVGYKVADPGDAIKLDAMESPWPWPGDLRDEWLNRLSEVALNRYPDPNCGDLKKVVREVFEVPACAELLLGNGSDELIQLINLAIAGHGRTVMAPAPSFAMYRVIATLSGSEFVEIDLADDYGLDLAAMQAAVGKHQPAVTYVAHPNNPTGNGLDLDEISSLALSTEGVVVVDEAYYAYADSSFLPRLLDHPNVLLLRTLSKVGLAGLRVGVLIAHPEWVEQLEKCRLPYNVGVLAQVSAKFALEHRQQLDEAIKRVLGERSRLAEELRHMPVVERVLPSETNFITFRLKAIPASRAYKHLLAEGVLVKSLDGSHPRLSNCLRVTVGTPQENDLFLGALSGLSAGDY
ncbi:histidinol-phosphate aminotransferase [Halorhodospira halochloris]|uniref:Histidinol-phosphate aminotransferase n=1 Tax=Halorhodospira halochloris TaxID=1052 RepID=A0A0X8XBP6_HALHR|nr:histidinol-phosphate transaminase [Halorhodospira halochloris]MBK1651669.1 histidinol-phosphate transaminase [Halorhodospira halochloris]BAU58533.1 histidinol-phosphate aminotransferase [Halorhodospira halochloris]